MGKRIMNRRRGRGFRYRATDNRFKGKVVARSGYCEIEIDYLTYISIEGNRLHFRYALDSCLVVNAGDAEFKVVVKAFILVVMYNIF